MKKSLLTLALISLSASVFAEGSTQLFDITPSILQTTVRSDSETSIQYTIRNNTASTVTGITMPTWPAGISIPSVSNTCSSSLAANAKCHFHILISGANQPSTLTLQPIMCIDNGIICSQADASHILTVNVLPITGNAYAYLSISDIPGTNYQNNVVSVGMNSPYSLVSNNNNNSGFSFTAAGLNGGGVAISNEGQYAFVVDRGHNQLDIFSLHQGVMTALLSSISIASNLQAIVVNPAGTRVYVSGGVTDRTVYAVNVSDKNNPTLITSNMSIDSKTFSLALSPDGSTLYVPCPYGGANRYGTIDVFNVKNDANTQIGSALNYQISAVPFGAVVSPDGTTVYITNNAAGYEGISEILNANDPTSMALAPLVVSLPSNSYPAGIALSPDGNTLYAVEGEGDGYSRVAVIDLATSFIHQIPLNNSQTTYSVGAALSPDGSKLFVSNNSSPPMSVVKLSDDSVTQAFGGDTSFGKSLVRSNFVN